MGRFGQDQPDVLEFLSEASSRWEADAADLAFHAALVIWLSFGETKLVEPSVLTKNYGISLKWIESMQGEAVLVQKKLADLSRYPEPELMRFVVELVFEAHEDGLEIEPEEQQQVLLVLKTIADSFAEVAAGP
jgi:hypothetical protein